MDLRIDNIWQQPQMTLADLCAAIENGRIACREDDEFVEVPMHELRRLENEDYVLGARFLPADTLARLDASCLP